MINYNISFGKKIPIATCKVKNKESGEMETATLYEYDCKDKEDLDEVKNTGKKWTFLNSFIIDMTTKFDINKSFKENYSETILKIKNNFFTNSKFNQRFFTLQTDEEDIIGFCQADSKDKDINIKYLESQFLKYKYVGSSILSILGSEGLKNGNKCIKIGTSSYEGLGFYRKLGFRETGITAFKLNKKGIKKLIKNTEKSTQSPIIDLTY